MTRSASWSAEKKPRSSVLQGAASSHHHSTAQNSAPTTVNPVLATALRSNDELFVKILYRLVHQRVVLTSSERKNLLMNIEKRLPDVHPKQLASLCWALGTLRLPLRTSGMMAVTDLMLERLDDCKEHLASSPEDLSQALVGLGRLEKVVVRLSKDSFLTHALPIALPLMDAQSVANSLWSLGKMGVSWDELPLRVRRALAEALTRVCTGSAVDNVKVTTKNNRNNSSSRSTKSDSSQSMFTPQGIANALFGLSQLRAKWDLLPPSVTSALVSALSTSVTDMNEQEASNTFSGLGRLGAEWAHLPPSLRDTLCTALLRNMQRDGAQMPVQGLAMSIHGLGRMNADFSLLPAPVRRALYRCVVGSSEKANDVEVSNMIYGLGKMGACHNSFDADLSLLSTLPEKGRQSVAQAGAAPAASDPKRHKKKARQQTQRDSTEAPEPALAKASAEALLLAVARESWRFAPAAVSNSLWGLMLMNASWVDIAPGPKQALLRALTREATRMDEQQVGTSLYALGKLGAPWTELPTSLQSELISALHGRLEEMKAAGVVMTMLGLSRSGLYWDLYTPSLRDALGEAVTRLLRAQAHGGGGSGVSAMVHALSATHAQWADLGAALQAAVLESIARAFWDPTPQSAPESLQPQPPGPTDSASRRSKEDSSVPLTLESLVSMQSSAAAALLLSAPVRPLTASGSARAMNPAFELALGLVPSPSPSPAVAASQVLNRVRATKPPEPPVPMPPSETVATALANPYARYKRNKSRDKGGADEKRGFAAASSPPPDVAASPSVPAITQSGSLTGDSSRAPPPLRPTSRVTRVDLVDSFEAMALSDYTRPGQPWSASALTREGIAAPSGLGSGNTPPRHGYRNPLVLSLARLGASWEGLTVDTRQALSTALINSLNPRWDVTGKGSLGSEEAPGFLHLRLHGVVGVLEGLAVLGASWTGLSPSLRSALRLALRRTAGGMGASTIATTILHLSELSVPWADLEGAGHAAGTHAALRGAILRQASYGPEALSRLLLGLGKLQRWSNLHVDVRQCLKAALVESQLVAPPTPDGVAQTLSGLAAMQCMWGELSTSVRLSLLRSLHRVLDSASAVQTSSMVQSLGAMRMPFFSLPDDIRGLVAARIAKDTPSLSAVQLAQLLEGLIGLEVEWAQLPTEVHAGITSALTAAFRLEAASSSHDALALSMGRLGMAWHQLPAPLFESLQVAFSRLGSKKLEKAGSSLSSPTAGSESSRWLSGLAKMGFRLCEMSADAQRAAISLLPTLSLLPSPSTAQFAGETKERRRSKAPAACLAVSDVSIALNSLGVMGLSSSDLAAAQRGDLVAAAVRVFAEGEPVEVAAAALGLALTDFSWSSLSPATRASLLAGVLRVATPPSQPVTACKRQAFWLLHAPEEPPPPSGVLVSEHRKPCSFNSLDTAAMCPSACASIMRSLSLLAFDASNAQQLYVELESVHEALLHTVERLGPERFTEREKEQMITFSQLFESLTPASVHANAHVRDQHNGADGRREPGQKTAETGSGESSPTPRCLLRADPVVGSPDLCNVYKTFPIDNLQHAVVASLANSLRLSPGLKDSLILAQDFSPFSGALPVDATIYDRESGQVLAFFEVDGPHHYTASGRLRRQDQLKEVLYKRAHPGVKFARVNFEQVAAVGTTEVGLAVISQLKSIKAATMRENITPSEYPL